MVKHIVVYTLKEGVDKDEAVKLIASGNTIRPPLRNRISCSDRVLSLSLSLMPEKTSPTPVLNIQATPILKHTDQSSSNG